MRMVPTYIDQGWLVSRLLEDVDGVDFLLGGIYDWETCNDTRGVGK